MGSQKSMTLLIRVIRKLRFSIVFVLGKVRVRACVCVRVCALYSNKNEIIFADRME